MNKRKNKFAQKAQPSKSGKDKDGCSIVLLVISLVFYGFIFMAGWWIKGLSDYVDEHSDDTQDRVFNLPTLTTDEEITAAVNSGETKSYCIKNYVFQKAQTIKDTVYHLLNGDYICIDVEDETNQYPSRQIVGDLYLNDGTPLQKPDSLIFVFSVLKKMYRIWESEINPEKKELFNNSRYYPNHGSSPCFNFTHMTKDEKATFAARLGNGKASLYVFPDKNIVIVGGDRIKVGDQMSLVSIIWTILGYLFMAGGIYFAIAALLGKNYMFDKKLKK